MFIEVGTNVVRSEDAPPRYVAVFHRMKRLTMLPVVGFLAIFLVVGCGGSGSQAEQDHAHHKSASASHSAELELRPEGGSGVSGTLSLEDVSEGVIVKLNLRALPKPNTTYLAHIHPGTCAQGEQEEEEGEAHEHGEHYGEHHEEGYGHEHGGGAEIEYPLSQVKSDSEGSGSSTTTLRETSIEKLFSGEPKLINVHAAGSGNPPVLSCAELKEAG